MNRQGLWSIVFIWLAGSGLYPGCLDLADDRARLDQEVGIGEAGGVFVRVGEGLAAIRHIEPGLLVLWAQAPQLDINLTVDSQAMTEWRVEVENCLATADLRATSNNETIQIAPAPDGNLSKTHRAWTLDLPPGGETQLLVAPSESYQASWSFGVVNDIHGAGGLDALIADLNTDETLTFIVSAGDITHMGERESMQDLQSALQQLNLPFYSTIGNHEQGYTATSDWHELFGRHNFHFQYREIAFSFVDSASASVSPRVYGWLDDWMLAAGESFHVFLTHVPPLDPEGTRNAGFRSRAEATKLLSRIARGGVDLSIHGHIHDYHTYRQAGIPAIISGGANQYLVVQVDPESGKFAASPVWAD